MKIIIIAAAAAAAGASAAFAQPPADPSDPAAPAPALVYRSVFQDLRAGVEEQQLDWREANADVARFARGHSDYLQWEEQQGGARPPAGDAAPGGPSPTAPAAIRRSPGHGHH